MRYLSYMLYQKLNTVDSRIRPVRSYAEASRSVQYVSPLLCLNISGWNIILSVSVCKLV